VYNEHSQIRVRLYSWREDVLPGEDLWESLLVNALRARKALYDLDNPLTACRLVFSEGDGLSGLIVDKYGPWLSVQFNALAMAQNRDLWLRLLEKHLAPRGVFLRTEKGVAELEGVIQRDGLISGSDPGGPVLVTEHGLSFLVDLASGHKTGFYLDQRDNRLLVRAFARGRRCLDMCCYTGGFSLNLAAGGAAEVHAADVSESALAIARENAAANGFGAIAFTKADAFRFIESLAATPERYGLIVLDPPRFAQSSKGVAQALAGYERLNTAAIRCLEPGGVLVTCSCSGRVTADEFTRMLARAASSRGRMLTILKKSGQACDHPVAAGCPESDYLKCFFCRVD
jgi:23S rRNA (cytosine1962-C5)-methyltransferase